MAHSSYCTYIPEVVWAVPRQVGSPGMRRTTVLRRPMDTIVKDDRVMVGWAGG